jgi:hypothetical protein
MQSHRHRRWHARIAAACRGLAAWPKGGYLRHGVAGLQGGGGRPTLVHWYVSIRRTTWSHYTQWASSSSQAQLPDPATCKVVQRSAEPLLLPTLPWEVQGMCAGMGTSNALMRLEAGQGAHEGERFLLHYDAADMRVGAKYSSAVQSSVQ